MGGVLIAVTRYDKPLTRISVTFRTQTLVCISAHFTFIFLSITNLYVTPIRVTGRRCSMNFQT